MFSSDVKTFSSLFHDNSDLVFLFQSLLRVTVGNFPLDYFYVPPQLLFPFP